MGLNASFEDFSAQFNLILFKVRIQNNAISRHFTCKKKKKKKETVPGQNSALGKPLAAVARKNFQQAETLSRPILSVEDHLLRPPGREKGRGWVVRWFSILRLFNINRLVRNNVCGSERINPT